MVSLSGSLSNRFMFFVTTVPIRNISAFYLFMSIIITIMVTCCQTTCNLCIHKWNWFCSTINNGSYCKVCLSKLVIVQKFQFNTCPAHVFCGQLQMHALRICIWSMRFFFFRRCPCPCCCGIRITRYSCLSVSPLIYTSTRSLTGPPLFRRMLPFISVLSLLRAIHEIQ